MATAPCGQRIAPAHRPASRARHRLTLTAAAVLALTALASVSGSSPALGDAAAARTARVAVHVSPTFFGIHDGSMQAYGHVSFGSVRLWDAGVQWRQVETAPGVYDWNALDSLVRNALDHGVQVTLVLAMTPSFAGPAANQPPTDLADFASYVRAVMSRYRDFDGQRGIAAYQVWNEGNVKTFWDASPAALARMTQIVDQVRDDVDPGATVVAPSFAVRLPFEQRWIREYESQQVDGTPVWRLYDASAVSLYPMATYGARPGGPEDAMRLLGTVRGLLSQAGVPSSKPVWATEINYGLRSGAPGQRSAVPISNRRQIANVLRTYLLGAARGLDRVFWYRYDWGRLPASEGGGTLGNTLLTVPGEWSRITPAGAALATAEKWLAGRLVADRARRPCAHDRRGTYTCLVRYASGTRTIMWNPARRVTVRVDGALSRVSESGRARALSGRAARVKVGYRPVMVVTR